MMLAAVRGRLISDAFARARLPALDGYVAPPPGVMRELDAWCEQVETTLGPASGVRTIADAAVAPLLRTLGYTVAQRVEHDRQLTLVASTAGGVALPVLVASWSEPLDAAWRGAVVASVAHDARWCLSCNGTALRIVDAQRTWSRRYLEFDLRLLPRDEGAAALLWALVRADALDGPRPLLDRAVDLSARHGVVVCRALGAGVLEALALLFARGTPFEDSLIVLYRVLFLLFAEARGLVPMWHPVYRDRYSIEAIVSALLAGRRYRGIWHAVRAISRLVWAGCRAGELKVTAFNGRLFSPDQAATFDRVRIDDDVMRRAVMAVSTVAEGGARTRIGYVDLDVEQLGAVYEHVLEYRPAAPRTTALERTRDARKASGTFYTPRSLTAYLVRQTLDPLVRNRTADDILRLRILDPAMGSGAFLVAACQYLALAVEAALVREGRWHQAEITPADRARVKREIAQRCLFGVDLNPMAVQLARLSLWLATLASDKPLSFLDHHLVVGDSLIGAAPADVLRQPTRGARRSRRQEPLPLFEAAALAPALEHAVRTRERLARDPDDSAAVVRAKEKTLAALQAAASPLGRWMRVLDLWCAGWFWQHGTPPGPGLFAELCERVLHDRSTLPSRTTDALLAQAAELAGRLHVHHWPLAFPEVFCGDSGEPPGRGGFDAVLGNPPWDMVRGDSGHADIRSERRAEANDLAAFVREAGVYRVETRSHVNRYQLFVERALHLVRRGGRVGLVLPGGVMTDSGSAALRRHIFDRADVDTVTGLDNRRHIFPIHRSVRFVLLTCTAGQPTNELRCRFGITDPDDLERTASRSIPITRRLLSRISGEDDLALPEVAGEADVRILERITARVPFLGAQAGWNVHFSRELNASDDRHAFAPSRGTLDARPVVEGKHVEPFRVALDRCRFELPDRAVSRRVPRRARLAYRDVASATNRLTLIAAIVPARVVTTHTLSCLRPPLPLPAQRVLCALLNSFVANYLVRLRVNTHVTAALLSRLPVPVPTDDDPAFGRLAELSRILAAASVPVEQMPHYAELQGLVARLYGLRPDEFAHILATFPLIASEVRAAALAAFNDLH
jgi:hypothetical protein